ncbi:MAG: hypothetical protein HYY04_02315 [Chloroflexi bacterium]|nr:hypothetical protein [Chloroflexota bacterium]
MRTRHRGLTFLIVALAIALAAAGCETVAGGVPTPPETAMQDETAEATPDESTVEDTASPTPVETPTPSSPTATPTVTPTPTPSPTPVPPSAEVWRSAKSLSEKLAAFRAVRRDSGALDRAAALQLDLLTEVERAEQALRGDRSIQADQVRDAIADIRDGDANRLEHALTSLRQLGGGGGRSSSTPLAGTPVAERLVTADLGGLTHGLNEKLQGYRQAQRERNMDQLLRRQRDLLNELAAVKGSLAGDDSEQARSLRAVIADLEKGLRGDPESLARASSALAALTGPTGGDGGASVDLGQTISSISEKLAAFRGAVARGDRTDVLRRQRELLDEVDRAEAAARASQLPDAPRLSEALRTLRGGLSGDLAKLDGAAEQLAKLGGATGTTNHPAGGDQAVDQAKMARALQDRLAAMRRALDSGGTDDLLRAQRDLLQTIQQIEPALKFGPGDGSANVLRGAVESIRNGLAGDVGKFDEAARQLAPLTGQPGPSTPAGSGTPQPKADVKPLANGVAGKLESVRGAQNGQDPAVLERARRDLEAEINRAEKAIEGDRSPVAARLREALTMAREAVAGDEAKLHRARQLLADLQR